LESRSIFRHLTKALQILFFPPVCPHCDGPTSDPFPILCPLCIDQLEPQSPFPFEKPFAGRLALFERQGAILTLHHLFQSGKRPFLADQLAPYFVVQALEANWPLPDLILYTPLSAYSQWKIGYNPSHLLAQKVSLILNRPLQSLLRPTHIRHPEWITGRNILLIDTQSSYEELFTLGHRIEQELPLRLYAIQLLQPFSSET